MKQEEPLISVVVPVYNVEAYLGRCLASIAAQTYLNREVILIDDASTDGSGCICDRWVDLDDRWQVIHLPQNKGLSAARNEGICRAKGQFITFIDSDDHVEPELLRKLYDVLSQSGAEVSVCGTDGLGTGDEPAHIYTRKEAVYAMARRSPFLWTAWGKLYPATLCKKYAFDDSSLCSEDLLFSIRSWERSCRSVTCRTGCTTMYTGWAARSTAALTRSGARCLAFWIIFVQMLQSDFRRWRTVSGR